MTLNFITHLSKRFLAADDAARTMQLAGLLRFTCIFLQGVILVKAGVPLVIVGQIELVFFVANFFMFFWQNGASNAMMAWASGEERTKVAGAIFSGMHIHALVAVCLMLVIAQFPVAGRFGVLTTGQNTVALLSYVFFSIPAGAIIYVYLLRQQFTKLLWFTGLSQMIQVGLVAWIATTGYSVQEMLWALAAFALLKWLFVLISGRWFVGGMTSVSTMWTFVVFAFPLVLHAFNSGLMDYVDGWIVSLFYGEESFALYRYGARELPFNALLIGGLMSGLVHRFKSGNSLSAATLRAETLRIMKLLFPINCILILFSPPLYTLLYSDDFVLSARIFNIYALTLLSRVIMNQVYCYVYHHNWILTWSTVAEVVINVVLSLFFMQWLGLFGIPLATVVAYAMQKVFLIYYVRRKFGIQLADYVPLAQCIWYFAGMILCVVISELIYF